MKTKLRTDAKNNFEKDFFKNGKRLFREFNSNRNEKDKSKNE